jgi:hypothetical protein
MSDDGWYIIKEFGTLERFGSTSPTNLDVQGTDVTVVSVNQVDHSNFHTADDVTQWYCSSGCTGYVEATLQDCAGASQFTVSVGWGEYYDTSQGECDMEVTDDTGTRTWNQRAETGWQTMGATSFDVSAYDGAASIRISESGTHICFLAYIVCRAAVWPAESTVIDTCVREPIVATQVCNPTFGAAANRTVSTPRLPESAPRVCRRLGGRDSIQFGRWRVVRTPRLPFLLCKRLQWTLAIVRR